MASYGMRSDGLRSFVVWNGACVGSSSRKDPAVTSLKKAALLLRH